jgi:hypothetical protein
MFGYAFDWKDKMSGDARPANQPGHRYEGSYKVGGPLQTTHGYDHVVSVFSLRRPIIGGMLCKAFVRVPNLKRPRIQKGTGDQTSRLRSTGHINHCTGHQSPSPPRCRVIIEGKGNATLAVFPLLVYV